jgi:hypothetical protein
MIAGVDGAFADGRGSGLEVTVADGIARTVRRMVVASTAVGAPLEEMVINFGSLQMALVPVRESFTLVLLLDRSADLPQVRTQVREIVRTLGQLLSLSPSRIAPAKALLDSEDDEVARLVGGELGPLLARIEDSYAVQLEAIGAARTDAAVVMRDQLKEWLLCCNPSPYTLPLLLDGLSQTLNEAPEQRMAFMSQMQGILKESEAWGTAG